MSTVNLQDKRSQKTRKAIKNAFVKLLSEEGIESITISQISRLAGINRKTFYMHYANTKEVMDEIENHVISSLEKMMDQTDVIQDVYDPHFFFDSLRIVLEDDPHYYQYLLNTKSHNTLLMKLKAAIKPRLMHLLQANNQISQTRLSLGVEFILSGTIALYQQWLDGERNLELSEISEVANELAAYAITNLIQKEKQDHAPAS